MTGIKFLKLNFKLWKHFLNSFKIDFYTVTLLFFIISVLLLVKPLASKGMFLGGDWSLPYTPEQMDRAAEAATSSWLTISTFLGGYRSYLTDVPFVPIYKIFSSLNLTGEALSKSLLLFSFTLGGIGMYTLLRYLGLRKRFSFFGGFLYITSPFYFNFAVMGWINILISMGLFPFYIVLLDKTIKRHNLFHTILAGLLWSLAMIQSTTIIWYSFATLSLGLLYIFKDKKNILPVFKVSFVVGFILFLANIHWIINLFLYPDPVLYGGENVLSSISLGTWQKLSILNLAKGWGSLFNYSYESSYPNMLKPLSYTLTLLFITGIKYVKNTRIDKNLFICLYGLPFILYLLGPQRLTFLPFANIIRDVARMEVLISFSMVTLSIILLNDLWKRGKYLVTLFICALLILSTYPFITFKLVGDQTIVEDISLRTYQFDEQYQKVDSFITHQNNEGRVLYLPQGQGVNIFSTKIYKGPFQEASAIFPIYSQKPGPIIIGDKDSSASKELLAVFMESLYTQDLEAIQQTLKMLNIKYLVFYHESLLPEDWALLEKIRGSGEIAEISDQVLSNKNRVISLFEVEQDHTPITGINKALQGTASATEVIALKNHNPEISLFTHPSTINSFNQFRVVKHNLEKIEISNIDKWHGGWSWPEVNRQPGTNAYKITVLMEKYQLYKEKDPIKRIDLLIWNASKRVSEMEKYGATDYLKEEHLRLYTQLQKEISYEWNPKPSDSLFGMITKCRNYLRKAHELQNLDTYSYYTKWLQQLEDAENNRYQEMLVIKKKDKNYNLFLWEEALAVQLSSPPETTSISSRDFVRLSQQELGMKLLDEKNPLRKSYKDHRKYLLNEEYSEFTVYKYQLEPDNSFSWRLQIIPLISPSAILITREETQVSGYDLLKNRKLYEVKEKWLEEFKPDDFEEGSLPNINIEIDKTYYPQKVNIYLLTDDINHAFKQINFIREAQKIAPLIEEQLSGNNPPEVTVLKSNRHEYKIRLQNVAGEFGLILNQQFDPRWKVRTTPPSEVTVQHYLVNNFENGWWVNPGLYKGNLDMDIYYAPQDVTEKLLPITLITYTAILIFITIYMLSSKK